MGTVSREREFADQDLSEFYTSFWNILAAILLSLPSDLVELHIITKERFEMNGRSFPEALHRLESLQRMTFRSRVADAKKDEIRRAVPALVQRNALEFAWEPLAEFDEPEPEESD